MLLPGYADVGRDTRLGGPAFRPSTNTDCSVSVIRSVGQRPAVSTNAFPRNVGGQEKSHEAQCLALARAEKCVLLASANSLKPAATFNHPGEDRVRIEQIDGAGKRLERSVKVGQKLHKIGFGQGMK